MNKPVGNINIQTDRRGFLAGIGISITGVPLQAMSMPRDIAVTGHAKPRPCVFNQMPYISFDGTGSSYDNTGLNCSTRDYVNSMSREEFLRRHWLY